jgi:hypothetical protein
MTNPNGHGGRRPGAGRPKSKTSLLREAAEQLLRRTAALTLIGSCVGWVVVVDGGLAGHIGSLLSNIRTYPGFVER